nr:bile acid:sodium symporter [bacterium]
WMAARAAWVAASVSGARARLGAFTPGAAAGAAALAAGFHFCLLALAAAAARALRLDPREARALWFAGSQKSLPVTVSILLMLGAAEDSGKPIFDAATAAAVILYFPQIVIDSLAAAAARIRGGNGNKAVAEDGRLP